MCPQSNVLGPKIEKYHNFSSQIVSPFSGINFATYNIGVSTKCTNAVIVNKQMSLVVRKPVFGVSDLVPHKPGCITTQDG